MNNSLAKRALRSALSRPGLAHRLLRNLPEEMISEAWLQKNQRRIVSGRFAEDLRLRYLVALVDNRETTKSQLGQDVFALAANPGANPGFYVEFGATNGVDLSNTWLLERFGWKGILAEPNPAWHPELRANRNAVIDVRCVYSTSGKTLRFAATEMKELGSLHEFVAADQHVALRQKHEEIVVDSVSLHDLLETHGAPRHIDYMSVDTEGSEWEILRGFDFSRHTFGAITVEHNYTPQREKIHGLLVAAGYTRVLTEISQWDDWYLRSG